MQVEFKPDLISLSTKTGAIASRMPFNPEVGGNVGLGAVNPGAVDSRAIV